MKFTFGFEIEGKFNEVLLNNFDIDCFKLDGSVVVPVPKGFEPLYLESNNEECGDCSGRGYYEHDDDCEEYCDLSHNCSNCEDGMISQDSTQAEEFASEVYSSLNDCLDDLSKFNEKTHAWDSSCGLHFHIGMKDNKDWQKLYCAISNLDFMKRLQSEAVGYCNCQRRRLQLCDNHYYPFWQNSYEMMLSLNRNEKYRFMNYHKTYKTLEFRFLCPCKHKVENVKRLVDSVQDYLNKKEVQKTTEYIEVQKLSSNVDLVEKIKLPAITRLRL